MTRAIYPGSFDPVTTGHLDIIKRAAAIFDEVIVCVLNNASKNSPLFSLEERVNMLCDVSADFSNVKVKSSSGLLIDFAAEQDIKVIVRGLRELTDFDFELQMAQANKTVSGDIETVFLATDPKCSFISSSMVKEFAAYGKPVTGLVPEIVAENMKKKFAIKG